MSKGHIVVPDDRDIVRHVQAALSQAPHHPARGQIVECGYRRDPGADPPVNRPIVRLTTVANRMTCTVLPTSLPLC